jgi:hypothetical protein
MRGLQIIGNAQLSLTPRHDKHEEYEPLGPTSHEMRGMAALRRLLERRLCLDVYKGARSPVQTMVYLVRSSSLRITAYCTNHEVHHQHHTSPGFHLPVWDYCAGSM